MKHKITIEVLTLAFCIALFPPIWAVIAPHINVSTGAVALICAGLYVTNGNKRSDAVKEAIVRNGAVYFAAVGGAGALLSKSILSSEVVAYDDLGTEAIRRLEVKDFPVIVVIDSLGNNLYETAIEEYKQED